MSVSNDPVSPIPNPTTFAHRRVLDCGTVQGSWTAKMYGILSEKWDAAALPSSDVLDKAAREAMKALDGPLDHPFGFAILHLANDGVYLLLTRFNNANNLRHSVFSVVLGKETLELARLADPQIIACVWELRLMMYEADAWIDAVLKPGKGLTSDATERYLARRYSGPI